MANILIEKNNNLAMLTMNRFQAGNAFNLEFVKELFETTLKLSHDDAVSIIVIKGNEQHFSFGGDLKSFADQGEAIGAHLKEVTSYLHQAISLLARMDKLVVALVHGTAAGAGLSMLSACDLVFANEKAKFTSSYTKVGLTPDGSCTYLLPRLIGLRKTQELIYMNPVLNAETAYEWGLVTKVFEDQSFDEETSKIIDDLVQESRSAMGNTKKLINESIMSELDSHMSIESDFISEAVISKDGKEGVSAFLEKRAPKYV